MTTRMRSDVQGTEDMAVFYCDVCKHEWTANYVLECEKCGFLKMQEEVVRLTKMIQYQQLYIQYLIGGISKHVFKKRAREFAEPLDIDFAIAKAKENKNA